MKSKETIADFHDLHGKTMPAGQFHIYRQEEFGCDNTPLSSNRRDFYKISLMVKGAGMVSYADRSIRVNGAVFSFSNPQIPYSWEPASDEQTGYFCLFTENFVDPGLKNGGLAQSPLFKTGGNHIFFPDEKEVEILSMTFENMFREMASSYANKYDLLRSYVQILMHEALKMTHPETYYQPVNASHRISELFLQLLEQQFPVDAPGETILLKNANEFAHQLSVHTNHLNRALKETTGKTTTEWISERILREARELLRRGDLDIAAIGHSLGFEHASNFNTFFKKQTGLTPLQFRKSPVSIS
ncbi:MAG TPA: helix-turn-helix domain-containing protein [Chitinophaga sp.]